MPNLTLTHSGNMNITNAYIAGNSLKVDYNKNNTGAVIGFTFTPEIGSEFVCGETYTITAVPKFSGTVLTENFLVSGVDIAGVRRTDTSTLRQGYDSNLEHYTFDLAAVGATIISSSITSTYAQVEIRIDNTDYAEIDFQTQGGAVITYPIDNISGDEPGPGPDTGVVATSITLVVDEEIVASGDTSVLYEPSDADVEISYSISDSSIATIDGEGHIEVLQDGEVVICAIEERSGLMDCKTVDVYLENPDTGDTGDTGTVINYLELIVDDEIVENGVAVPVYSPATADTLFVFTSSDPGIATIDSEGNITVLDNGEVTFCVRDEISGLEDCKTVIVRKAVYITGIELLVDDEIILEGSASTIYSPTGGTVALYYSSSNPYLASIDPITGEITVHHTGTVVFCVRDAYTNLTDCKSVSVVGTDGFVELVYNVTSTTNPTLLFSLDECCGNMWSDFASQIFYKGVRITPGDKYFTFPETGRQSIYVDFKPFTASSGRLALANCIFRDVRTLVKVVFPEDYRIVETGNFTFFGCTNLEEVVMPSFAQLNYSSFYGCSKLSAITITNLETIGEWSLAYTGLKNVYGPNVVTVVKDSFSNTKSLESAVFPKLVTIGDDVFSASTIESFTFVSSVTNCGNAFRGATRLRNVTFESITPPTRGSYPFSETKNLFNIWVPCQSLSAYKTWAPSAVKDKIRCTNVDVDVIRCIYHLETPGNPVYICAQNAGIVSIKDEDGNEMILSNYAAGATYSYYYFDETGDTAVNITVDVDYVNTNGLGVMFASGFGGLKDIFIPSTITNGNVCFSGLTSLENAVLPSGWTTLADKVFYQTGISTVTLPANITKIPYYAFYDCTNLTGVSIPNSVTLLDSGAFSYCSAISAITIPSSVTTIKDECFNAAVNCKTVYFEGTTPPTLGGSETRSTALPAYTYSSYSRVYVENIYVPCEAVNTYKNQTGAWNRFKGLVSCVS